MYTTKNAKSGSLLKIPRNEQSLVGPQAVCFDNFSIQCWTLMTHGSYTAYPHKDVNRLCTWIFTHVGVKIWAIMEPKYTLSEHDSRCAQFDLHYKMTGACFLGSMSFRHVYCLLRPWRYAVRCHDFPGQYLC